MQCESTCKACELLATNLKVTLIKMGNIITSIASAIASKLAGTLVDPTINEVRCWFCVTKIEKDLETEKEQLITTRERRKKRAKETLSKTHIIEETVTEWLAKASNLIADVGELQELMAVEKQQQELMGNGGCFGGRCPTLERYSLCKQMAGKTKKMTDLNNVPEFNPFSHLAPILDIELFSSGDFVYFESTKLAFDQILEALRDDDCYMIGLYGTGGSGKSTLVRELGKKAKERQLFDHVALITVSQTPDVRKIQGEIADLLNVKLEKDSEPGRAGRISLKLKTKERILVILDNVWAKINLEQIGIPLDGHDNSCKVLLTTRHQSVCDLMECQKRIPLGLLSEVEAWALFQQHAKTNDENRAVGEKISKECKRLPIAIVAVGNSLKGKDIDDMKIALYKLRHPELVDVEEGEKYAFTCLRLSYDYLQREAKLLFLMCAMFPEDHDISREDLFRYGKGFGLCSKMGSIEMARSQLKVFINDLIDSCLLTNLENKDDHFRMHDMIRNVALWIASKEDHTIMISHEEELNTLANEEAIEDCYALCRWHEVLYQFPHQLNAPKLEIMIMLLRGDLTLSHVSCEGIKGLKVMALMHDDWRSRGVLTMPQSTQWLANLRTLRLVDFELGDISFVASLRRLEILDLHGSRFNELPDGIKGLSKLKLLDLSECDIKKPCKVIERCSKLQELYALSNYGNVKVPWECLNSDTFPKLERYHLKVGPIRDHFIPEVLSSKSLFLEEFSISTLGAAVKDLLRRANQIKFYNLQGGCKNIFPEMDQAVGGMNALNHLIVYQCHEIECLVGTAPSQASSPGRLQMIIPVGPKLCYLKSLEITNCGKLTTLFPMSVAQTLVRLQKLSISSCNGLRDVMKNEGESQLQTGNMFQQLEELNVESCKELECIFPVSCSHGFSQLRKIQISYAFRLKHVIGISNCAFSMGCNLSCLEELQILQCPLLTTLFPTSVNERGDSLEFPRLQELFLYQCPKLQYIFPISCIQSLVNLKMMNIQDLSGLEFIFGPDDCENHSTDGIEIQIVFPRLENFYLRYAPNVHQILPENFRSTLPEDTLRLTSCPELTTVSFNTVTGSEQRRQYFYTPLVEIIDCGVENIFHAQRTGFDEDQQQLIFSKFSRLELENLPQLRFIWKGASQIFSLQFLKELVVNKCGKLKCIFNAAVHKSMPLLADISISECEELEEIFEGNEKFHNPLLDLPKLKMLELIDLPSLVKVWHGYNVYEVDPNKIHISIDKCPKLGPPLNVTITTRKPLEQQQRPLERGRRRQQSSNPLSEVGSRFCITPLDPIPCQIFGSKPL